MRHIGLRFEKYVNDPIWGEVPLTAVELKIINTKPFRRLQHIRQMGFAYLAFPTANHRRYEHCIGAMHVAHMLSDIIADIAEQELESSIAIGTNHFQAVRLAALLHDIGHPPYSHAFEEAVSKNPSIIEIHNGKVFTEDRYRPLAPLAQGGSVYSHEFFTRYLIEKHEEIVDVLDEWHETVGGFSREEIAALAIGQAKAPGLALFNPIISGDFDADRIDYICRDSYYCGFNQRFNLGDLRRNLVIVRSPEDNARRPYGLMLRDGAIPAITTLLWYRYRLMLTVHLHPINRIATQALVNALPETVLAEWKHHGRDIGIDRERLDQLIGFHCKMTDEECSAYIDSPHIHSHHAAHSPISEVLRGEMPEQVHVIDTRHLTSDERIFLHFFMQEPRFITNLQSRIRNHLDLDVLVDVRLAKSPKFRTLVLRDGDDETRARSIFDTYYATHGIMIDTLNTLSLFVYHSNADEFNARIATLDGSEFEPRFIRSVESPFRMLLATCLEQTYEALQTSWLQANNIYSLEFLLCVLGSLEDLSNAAFGERCWSSGDGRLQTYIRRVANELNTFHITPKYHWTGSKYSVDVFIDFEVLSNLGLVDHIHVPVAGAQTNRVWFGSRIDRRLSTFGYRYYRNRLVGKAHHNAVYQLVNQHFQGARDALEKVVAQERRLHQMGPLDDHRATEYARLEDLRRELSGPQPFPVLLTRPV